MGPLELSEAGEAARIFERQRCHKLNFYARQQRPKPCSLGFREYEPAKKRSLGQCARARVGALRRPASAMGSHRVPAISSTAVPRPSSAATPSAPPLRQAWSVPILAAKAAVEQQQHNAKRRALFGSFAARLSWQSGSPIQASAAAAPDCKDTVSLQVAIGAALPSKTGNQEPNAAKGHSRTCCACERRELLSEIALAARRQNNQLPDRTPAALLDGLGFVGGNGPMLEQAAISTTELQAEMMSSPLGRHMVQLHAQSQTGSSQPMSPGTQPTSPVTERARQAAAPPILCDLACSCLSSGAAQRREAQRKEAMYQEAQAATEQRKDGRPVVPKIGRPVPRFASETVTEAIESTNPSKMSLKQRLTLRMDQAARAPTFELMPPTVSASSYESLSSERSSDENVSTDSEEDAKAINTLWRASLAHRVQRFWRQRATIRKQQREQQPGPTVVSAAASPAAPPAVTLPEAPGDAPSPMAAARSPGAYQSAMLQEVPADAASAVAAASSPAATPPAASPAVTLQEVPGDAASAVVAAGSPAAKSPARSPAMTLPEVPGDAPSAATAAMSAAEAAAAPQPALDMMPEYANDDLADSLEVRVIHTGGEELQEEPSDRYQDEEYEDDEEDWEPDDDLESEGHVLQEWKVLGGNDEELRRGVAPGEMMSDTSDRRSSIATSYFYSDMDGTLGNLSSRRVSKDSHVEPLVRKSLDEEAHRISEESGQGSEALDNDTTPAPDAGPAASATPRASADSQDGHGSVPGGATKLQDQYSDEFEDDAASPKSEASSSPKIDQQSPNNSEEQYSEECDGPVSNDSASAASVKPQEQKDQLSEGEHSEKSAVEDAASLQSDEEALPVADDASLPEVDEAHESRSADERTPKLEQHSEEFEGPSSRRSESVASRQSEEVERQHPGPVEDERTPKLEQYSEEFEGPGSPRSESAASRKSEEDHSPASDRQHPEPLEDERTPKLEQYSEEFEGPGSPKSESAASRQSEEDQSPVLEGQHPQPLEDELPMTPTTSSTQIKARQRAVLAATAELEQEQRAVQAATAELEQELSFSSGDRVSRQASPRDETAAATATTTRPGEEIDSEEEDYDFEEDDDEAAFEYNREQLEGLSETSSEKPASHTGAAEEEIPSRVSLDGIDDGIAEDDEDSDEVPTAGEPGQLSTSSTGFGRQTNFELTAEEREAAGLGARHGAIGSSWAQGNTSAALPSAPIGEAVPQFGLRGYASSKDSPEQSSSELSDEGLSASEQMLKSTKRTCQELGLDE